MSVTNPPKPRSEKALKYIKRKGISDYDLNSTVLCYLFEDMQILIERVNALEEEVEQLNER